MVWGYGGKGASYPQNLGWIHAAVSENPEFTDAGWTDAGRLRHDSSSADKVKQSYKMSGHMAQSNHQLKFETTRPNRFRHNCDTDDETDDGQILIS